MRPLIRTLCLAVLVGFCAAMVSCGRANPLNATYQVNTVRFVAVDPAPGDAQPMDAQPADAQPAGPVPGIWIDTNIEISGLFGGTVESSKPYAIRFDHTDNARQFTAIEILGVEVLYDDAEAEPGAALLDLPLRVEARDYESVNSVAGGRVVRTTSRILSGEIPGFISRDEDLRVRIEGRFIKDDGAAVGFTIDQHYEAVQEITTKKSGEVLQDW